MKSFLKCYLKTLLQLTAIVCGGAVGLSFAATTLVWFFSDDPLKQFGGFVGILLLGSLIVTWFIHEPDHGDCEELAHDQ